MVETGEDTAVVIVGAGVAGLTLGNFLLRNGIGCVVLEKHSREYVERRQRAGTIDSRGVRMFREWGLDEVLEGAPISQAEGGFWIDGEELPIEFEENDDNASLFCPQQVLVRNLTDVFRRDGGDLRFEAADVRLEDVGGERPLVRYRDAAGSTKVVSCDFVAGCDGDRGVSRAAIPAGALTRHSHEYGYAWLSVLAEVPAHPHIWNYQAFATWITETMHNAGDASYEGEFRKQIARAELERQFTSPSANRLFGELAAGEN
ncbi:FAD-dependent monooxygenase [Nonomuraea sp. NPDC048901]|uniref:FAD-dependent monooxygenase n=1 Tax=Nonomuraea sp. NPDC048901 TaxID=3155627 RepID=UPI0033C31104